MIEENANLLQKRSPYVTKEQKIFKNIQMMSKNETSMVL